MATAKKLSSKKTSNKSTTPYVLKDVYQEVTDAVIKALEEGTAVWKCSWNKAALPINVTTKKEYRGWNVFWLNFHSLKNGYKLPFYITFKQTQEMGGTIKKGEKGAKITYWATIPLKDSEGKIVKSDNPLEPAKTRLVPKDFTVFNIEQTEGIKFPKFEIVMKSEASIIEACEQVISDMPQQPIIQYDGKNAYYIPFTDTVVVPNLEMSKTSEAYYSTLFHELAHSTGHSSRLNRKELVESDGFGNENYSKEELTAEMTAAFLCAITGIQEETIPNSAAYIANWLKALKNDKKLILKAAAQAQKAADFILNKTFEVAVAC